MTSQGSPALVSSASRCRTVCDLPAPVAPVTSACLLRVGSGSRNSPAGRSCASRIAPRLTGARAASAAARPQPRPDRPGSPVPGSPVPAAPSRARRSGPRAGPGLAGPGRAGPGLAGHVELAGVEYPQPRYLPLGQPGERSQHTRGGQERRLGIAASRIHVLRRQGSGERPRLQARAEPVGMVTQVGRPGEHGRQPGKLARGRGPDEHPHRPQARLAERVQLREPACCLISTGPEAFLLMLAQHRDLGAQPSLCGVEQAGGLGHHEPAEGQAAGRGQRGLEPARRPGFLAGDGRGLVEQRQRLAPRAERPDQRPARGEPARGGRPAPGPGREEQGDNRRPPAVLVRPRW